MGATHYLSNLATPYEYVRISREKKHCYVVLCCVMLCHVMLCCAVLCCVMLCCVMLCYVMLCYVMLCYVMLCYVMLCYVTLCCFLLCYFTLPYSPYSIKDRDKQLGIPPCELEARALDRAEWRSLATRTSTNFESNRSRRALHGCKGSHGN